MARARKVRTRCAEAGCPEQAVKLKRCSAHYTAEYRRKRKTGEAVPRPDLGEEPARLFFFVRREEADYFRGRFGKGQASTVLRAWFQQGIRAEGYEPPP